MKSSTTQSFRESLQNLPPEVRLLAHKNFKLWLNDSRHPSLQFKKVKRYWSARIGLNHRALARETDAGIEWFWIGSHEEYDRLLDL